MIQTGKTKVGTTFGCRLSGAWNHPRRNCASVNTFVEKLQLYILSKNSIPQKLNMPASHEYIIHVFMWCNPKSLHFWVSATHPSSRIIVTAPQGQAANKCHIFRSWKKKELPIIRYCVSLLTCVRIRLPKRAVNMATTLLHHFLAYQTEKSSSQSNWVIDSCNNFPNAVLPISA